MIGDMVIFQKNLKKNSTVKIKNNKNNKSVIATVGKRLIILILIIL